MNVADETRVSHWNRHNALALVEQEGGGGVEERGTASAMQREGAGDGEITAMMDQARHTSNGRPGSRRQQATCPRLTGSTPTRQRARPKSAEPRRSASLHPPRGRAGDGVEWLEIHAIDVRGSSADACGSRWRTVTARQPYRQASSCFSAAVNMHDA